MNDDSEPSGILVLAVLTSSAYLYALKAEEDRVLKIITGLTGTVNPDSPDPQGPLKGSE